MDVADDVVDANLNLPVEHRPPNVLIPKSRDKEAAKLVLKDKKIQNLKGDLYLCFGQKMDLEVLKSYATKAILQTRKLLLIDTHTSTAQQIVLWNPIKNW